MPLPGPVLAALASIAANLRDLPRACIGDPAELVFWLKRTAARVDGVAALRVATSPPRSKRPSPAVPDHGLTEGRRTRYGPWQVASTAASGRDLAEAVFGPSPSRGGAATRTVVSRRGQRVAVEIRRAREGGQAELPW